LWRKLEILFALEPDSMEILVFLDRNSLLEWKALVMVLEVHVLFEKTSLVDMRLSLLAVVESRKSVCSLKVASVRMLAEEVQL
jgi:hypothetical protein